MIAAFDAPADLRRQRLVRPGDGRRERPPGTRYVSRCGLLARRSPGGSCRGSSSCCDWPTATIRCLGRPLALYDVVPDAAGRPHSIDVVYLVVGKMTRLLAEFPPGSRLEVWGPLGNGFPPTPAEHLLMVAGGIGQTPLSGLGPRASRPARLRRSAAAGSAGETGHALLRRPQQRLSGRRGRLPPRRRRGAAEHRGRLDGPSRLRDRI